jgi:16S rRNA (guanine966-N2)-methyltransferase
VRVIAGRLGGRTFRAPKGDATRPTSDRVREALFQVLGDLDGLRVLDLYAGSGALGIEALSRGASCVLFVESNRQAAATLERNLADLGLAGVGLVVRRNVERAQAELRAHAPYDLLLADPPWANLTEAAAALGPIVPLLSPGARVVLEHARRDQPPVLPLGRVDERTWGDTAVSIYQQQEQEKP